MPKTLTQRYEELNAEVERLRGIEAAVLYNGEDKAWEDAHEASDRAERASEDLVRCKEALRQAIEKREELVRRLMKGKGEKWLPPEKAPVAYFEEA